MATVELQTKPRGALQRHVGRYGLIRRIASGLDHCQSIDRQNHNDPNGREVRG